MRIRKADPYDLPVIACLMLKLWPDHDLEEMMQEAATLLDSEDTAIFLAEEGEGFAQCQLRYDYVEGTQTSPVGYLEGIYVEEGSRKLGLARELLSACEDWAKEKGCREFASDCELENTQSLQFHMAVGFEEANRIICFTKKL